MVFFGWLGVEHILDGSVLLAMQNTDFSIAFSLTTLGVAFLAALSLSSFLFFICYEEWCGHVVVGGWELGDGGVCLLGCRLEVFGFCDAWWCFGGLFWGLFMAGVWSEGFAMG